MNGAFDKWPKSPVFHAGIHRFESGTRYDKYWVDR